MPKPVASVGKGTGADFRRARYDLITRHALALSGVVAAEIHLSDAPGGPLRLIAASTAPPIDASSDDPSDQSAAPASPSDTRAFFQKVLANPGLHDEPTAPPRNRAVSRDVSAGPVTRVTHLVAGRMEPIGQVRGLMVFALDREVQPAEHTALQDFVVEAQKICELEVVGKLTQWAASSTRLEAVLQLAQTTLLSGDLPTTLQTVTDSLRALFNAELAAIILLDEADGVLKLAAAATSDPGGQMLRERSKPAPPRDAGVTGWVARTMRPALIADADEDDRPEARPRSTPESMIAAPFITDGRLAGILRITALGRNRFGPRDLRLIEAVASQVAVVVEAARLRDEMRRQNESLALLARLVEASRDAIMLIDPGGYIQHCNPAMEALFGYAKGAAAGKQIRNLMSDRDSSALRDEILATLREVGDWQGEIELVRSDESHFPAELNASVVLDELGARIGWVTIVHDLTRRKLWEQELVQTEKLRSLGVMAAGVAHEVNNTLAMVLGQAELLWHVATDPTARRYLEAIILAAEDGAGAVRRITQFARPGSGSEFTPVDLAQVANDVLRATAPRWRDQAGREGRIIDARAVATTPVWVNGLATELREAVTNLVLNAVDALPDGGSIGIEVKEQDGRAVLTVSDTGTGMPEEVRERVFDPFFTTKPFGVGTGLGLALSYGIVDRHQGTVRVASQPGRGTTFEIELALTQSLVQIEQKAAGRTTRALRILVVEDEQVLGDQLRTMLSLDGHTIRLCNSGQEALDALDEPYDLVITDLGMPGIGGKEVASAAKARFPDVKVGLVTGWTSDTLDLDDLRERGIDFVVPKPYRIQTIREAVAKACAPAVAVSSPDPPLGFPVV